MEMRTFPFCPQPASRQESISTTHPQRREWSQSVLTEDLDGRGEYLTHGDANVTTPSSPRISTGDENVSPTESRMFPFRPHPASRQERRMSRPRNRERFHLDKGRERLTRGEENVSILSSPCSSIGDGNIFIPSSPRISAGERLTHVDENDSISKGDENLSLMESRTFPFRPHPASRQERRTSQPVLP
ncbi:uncharacterized protein LOC143833551 [Paroedura picta]|uniref:uncharacterized protein LOC143833551 n=1 Tax=Paroedura picta TaxID=143630 RepID=UPI00405601EA